MPRRNPRKTHRSVRLSYELNARLEDAANALNIDASTLIRRAILFYLDYLEEEQSGLFPVELPRHPL